jgi:hypothetical protein
MRTDKANYRCKDYVKEGHGNCGFCRLLGYPCVNVRRFLSCPREDDGVYYCMKCGKFDNKVIWGPLDLGPIGQGSANIVLHTPYPNNKDADKGCGGRMIRKDPDKWAMQCPKCKCIDRNAISHECTGAAGQNRSWVCPVCEERVETTNISAFFKEM